MTRRSTIALALLAPLLLPLASARATTMIPLDLAALTASSEVVVHGRVTAMRAAWTSDHEAIYTDVTVHIDRVLAGPLSAGQDLVVRREGGVVDGVGMKVYGAPAFAQGEEVVLFVERRGQARYVVGMAQGKLHVYADAAGKKHLRRNLAEIAYTRAPTANEQKLSLPAQAGQPIQAIDTVDELAAEVDRLVHLPRKSK